MSFWGDSQVTVRYYCDPSVLRHADDTDLGVRSGPASQHVLAAALGAHQEGNEKQRPKRRSGAFRHSRAHRGKWTLAETPRQRTETGAANNPQLLQLST